MSFADKVLIKLAKTGSKTAFEALIRKYHPIVSKFAYGIIGNAEVAADISQETFLKLYLSLPKFKITKAKLSTWLYKVTKNLCLNEVRISKRFVPLDENIAKENFEDSAVSKIDLYEALNGLDIEHRQAFLLVNLNGLSYEETAEVLGIPLGTVKSRIHSARKLLIEKLGASYQKEMV